ncbi:MAG: NAD-binding protein, partial [bacterium]
MANASQGHQVAVIGGATAGAEVASRLADRGVSVTVFEQNIRPYGKIEDGL